MHRRDWKVAEKSFQHKISALFPSLRCRIIQHFLRRTKAVGNVSRLDIGGVGQASRLSPFRKCSATVWCVEKSKPTSIKALFLSVRDRRDACPTASFRSGLLVGALSLLVVFAAAGADEIAVVRTVDELQKVKPVALAGGGEIRLGLAESGPDGGPWKLLYGLVKAGGGRDHVQRLRDELQPLGPVFFKVKSPRPVQEAREKQLEAVREELAQRAREADGQDLFCAGC